MKWVTWRNVDGTTDSHIEGSKSESGLRVESAVEWNHCLCLLGAWIPLCGCCPLAGSACAAVKVDNCLFYSLYQQINRCPLYHEWQKPSAIVLPLRHHYKSNSLDQPRRKLLAHPMLNKKENNNDMLKKILSLKTGYNHILIQTPGLTSNQDKYHYHVHIVCLPNQGYFHYII